MNKERWMDLGDWSHGVRVEAAERGFLAWLRDGTSVLLRPVGPDDKMRIEEGMSNLSPRSIYYRFGRQMKRLSDRELQYFTEVDHVQHIAWCAVDPGDPGESGLGIGRLIREPDRPSRAEFALTVIDPYHGLGLGTVLLATLKTLAEIEAVEILRACVLAENHAVIAWFQRLGARLVDSDCQVILDWDLRDGNQDTPSAHRFLVLSQQIRQVLGERATRQPEEIEPL
jgi:GNAT superfamily N-acetyltransferase